MPVELFTLTEKLLMVGILAFSIGARYLLRNRRTPFDLLLALPPLLLPAFGILSLGFAVETRRADLGSMVLIVLSAAVGVFLFLSELMYLGFGRWLTKQRGDRWVKEIDYIYLLLGGVGVAASMNRMDLVGNKIQFIDAYGPFVLAVAIAIRLIKTRVEINGWEKPLSAAKPSKKLKR
jgi:hypothetical protein